MNLSVTPFAKRAGKHHARGLSFRLPRRNHTGTRMYQPQSAWNAGAGNPYRSYTSVPSSPASAPTPKSTAPDMAFFHQSPMPAQWWHDAATGPLTRIRGL